MIVLDASAAVEWLLQTTAGKEIDLRIFTGSESLHAPEVIDLEVTQVLRRLARDKRISVSRAGDAVQDLADLRITRYPHLPLIQRIWQLRDNVSAYDGAYVALAEVLGATLVTRDQRLDSAAIHRARVEVH